MLQVYILSGCRTPIGKFQGQFDNMSAIQLGTIAVSEAIKRAMLEPVDIQHLVLGQVLTAGQGQNPARQVAIKADIPITAPAYTINMLCGSGLKAVALAYQAIRGGDYDLVVAGGQENMSKAHHSGYLRKNKMGDVEMKDTIMSDGLLDAFFNVPMGATAEHLANEYKVSREDQDDYACKSQNKAEVAIKSGWFNEEIINIPSGSRQIEKDEFPRFEMTTEKLAKLKPAYCSDPEDGSVTAGNSSGVNDGAAAMVLASEHVVNQRNLKPLARIIGFSEIGIDPMLMGIAPVTAIEKLLTKIYWSKEDVDLYEVNEAFAVQSILVRKMLGISEEKLNISGGAIALGHPIGCSGTRVLVTLVHNLMRLKKKKGVAALCIGGGMGIAIAIEMC